MTKKPTIEVADGALDNIPEDEREDVLKLIQESFEGFDPREPPGKPVLALEPGTTTCPICDGPLELAGESHGHIFLECEACDECFGTVAQ